MKELPQPVRYLIPAVAALAVAVSVVPLSARPTAEEEERWRALQETFFEGKTIEDAGGLLGIEAPSRAHDAAIVPIRITLAPEADVRTLSLLVDDNPVPRAAVVHFGPASVGDTLETRVRVDEYTHIRAVAQMSDGRFLATSAFVKAAGGCSAPALKDPEQAMARLGRMKLNLPEVVTAGTPVTAQVLISHPNSSGLQFDQISRTYIPAHYVEDISIRYNDVSILEVETDISISEDPSLHFTFVPSRSGTLDVVARDSRGGVYERSWTIDAVPAS